MIILLGVQNGIERFSRIMMPLLLLLAVIIVIYSVMLPGALEGVAYFLIPDISHFSWMTVVSAMGQLFYSLSVAMGIMIAYGSYVKDSDNLVKSINHIEIFDTMVAFLAGVMILPAVFVFQGRAGMEASGPSLMFVSLPKVFAEMGGIGRFVGLLFFAMVLFAALTSSISILEAIVSSLMDKFKWSRTKAVIVEMIIAVLGGLAVCFGYNIWYFDFTLPNGAV
jgi:NSS family neurotransmitter:Na+ symporter